MASPKPDLLEADDLDELVPGGVQDEAAGPAGAPPPWPAHRLVAWADSRELRYDSTDDRGQARRYSGRIYLPMLRIRRKAQGLPLVVYIHATVGKWDEVPLFNRGPEAMAGAMLANVHHFAVAMPDMPGFGLDAAHRPHPFCHPGSLAPAVLDMIQPSLALMEREGLAWDGRVLLVGYSAGGYAALAAVKAWQSEPRHAGIPLTGAACLSGPFRFDHSFRALLLSRAPYDHPDLLPMMFLGFQDLFPGVAACRLEAVFEPRLLAFRQGGLDHGRIQDWLQGGMDSVDVCRKIRQRLTGSPTAALPIRALVQPGWLADQVDTPAWPETDVGRVLRAFNLVGGWNPSVPILLGTSPGDACVAPENTYALLADWVGHGGPAPVTFLPLTLFGQALSHRLAALPALLQAFRWCARQPRGLSDGLNPGAEPPCLAQKPSC